MAGTELLAVGAMFAAVAAASFVSSRLDVSAIPLYILAGLGANEHVAGALGLPGVTANAFVTVGAELGIVFLLFFLGLEFNLERLVADRARIGTAGVADFAVNFTLGAVVGWLVFGGLVPAILVGGIVYISSSAIITKTMLDLGWIANPESGPILGTLVFEDLVIAAYLALVSAVVLGGETLGEAARAVAIALAFIGGLVLLAALGATALERLLETTSSEFFVLRALGVTVPIAGAALVVGVSEAVAAFFVGMAFSNTGFVHDLETSLAPLRDTFAAVFFFWIGLVTDPALVVAAGVPVLALVAVSIPGKLLSGYYGGRVYDLDDRRAFRVGLGLVPRGEFSLIIAAAALAAAGASLPQTTADAVYAATVGYVLVMSLVGTLSMQAAGRIEHRLFAP
jgi:CPA2 family monovalent cation:H+ antiporter-2